MRWLRACACVCVLSGEGEGACMLGGDRPVACMHACMGACACLRGLPAHLPPPHTHNPIHADLLYEEELLRNPYSLKMWWRCVLSRMEGKGASSRSSV